VASDEQGFFLARPIFGGASDSTSVQPAMSEGSLLFLLCLFFSLTSFF
jgi:hypothetical protein